MNSIAWRAYYADGQVYTSREHTPLTLPREGLVCVLEYLAEEWAPSKHYRRIVSLGDWYWYGERWEKVKTGEWGEWQPKPVPEAIRSTQKIPETQYRAIMDTVMAAQELP